MGENVIIVIDDDDEHVSFRRQAPPRGEDARLTIQGIRGSFRFVRDRPSGAIVNNSNDLTLAELQALVSYLQSLSEKMDIPATIGDFERFLTNLFDGWNSSSTIPPYPLATERKFTDTRILVGILKEDHPLSRAQLSGGGQQRRERRAGQPVYFGLSLNYETGVVDWAWRDSKNAGISPEYVLLDPGHTNITIRTQVMIRYDTAERLRVRTYNSSYLTVCAQHTIRRWAQAGTARDPNILDADRPFNLLSLVLAGPTARPKRVV